MIEINDQNYLDFCDFTGDNLGTLCATLPSRIAPGMMECAPHRLSANMLIPEAQWQARLEAMQGRFARQAYERQNPKTINQSSLSYCWAWSLTQTGEVARAVAGHPYVELAPESLGGTVGWRNAGSYLDAGMTYAAKHGICAREFVTPYDINPRNFKPGWEANALQHVIVEWTELGSTDMWAECVTALLLGYPIYAGFNWWRHAVMLDELLLGAGEFNPTGPNSWGPNQRFTLRGSKKIPDSAFVPRVVTYSAA